LPRWLVDGMNVVGARPDGWWRDRTAAMARLTAALDALARETGDPVTVVFDGRPRDVPAERVEVRLRRALDTARPLAERHRAPLRVRDELKEVHYGAYQDVPKGETKLRLKRFHRVRRMPGGESLRDVFDRVRRTLAEIESERRAGRHVAVVAHFWSLRMLVGHVRGLGFDEVLDRDDYTPANASVRRV
jgi:broad specificity phosphatase PhoE